MDSLPPHGCWTVPRYRPAARRIMVVICGIFIVWIPSAVSVDTFAAADHGLYVATYRRQNGDVRIQVRDRADPSRLHIMRGMQPPTELEIGDHLVKVPGEYHIRKVSAQQYRDEDPAWFEHGFEGLGWFLFWMILLEAPLLAALLFTFSEMVFLRDPAVAVVQIRLGPFRWRRRTIPIGRIRALRMRASTTASPALPVPVKTITLSLELEDGIDEFVALASPDELEVHATGITDWFARLGRADIPYHKP